MGLNKPSNTQWLKIAFGRIVKPCQATTPEAVPRVKSDGETVYELIWESVTGTLKDITVREHPDYGRSWILTIQDGQDVYGLQVQEDSNYGRDLLKKIPNLFAGFIYEIKPFDYEKNKKQKTGIWFQNITTGERVETYYQKFEEKQGGGWNITNLHGFPDYDGSWDDKDEVKVYFIRLNKFLRAEAVKHIEGAFKTKSISEGIETENEGKDLPF